MRIIISILIIICFLSCKRKWTTEDKTEFLGGCLKGAIKDMGEEKAKPYCSCLLDKIVVRYPDARDAAYIKYDSAIVRMAKECLKQQ
ncbi:MAG: hypothetical protein ACXWCZ_04130 [Flavisolibacter sp.]